LLPWHQNCTRVPASFLARREEYTVQKDPVCGMDVETDDSETSTYQDKVYHFCSEECKDTFDEEPLEYVNKEEEPAA
jgi:YHS domain-containing protein